MSEFSRVIAHPEFLVDPEFPAEHAPNLTLIPSIYFSGYHPDCCYAFDSAGQMTSPLHAYHSLIVLAAYKNDVPLEQVRQFFNSAFFEKAGYFGVWASDKANTIAKFSQYGLDITQRFSHWTKDGPFMHSIDHPAIIGVHDIAKIFMKTHSIATYETHIRPHDNLLQGPCFPVYPDIADALGVRGSYLFKLGGQYKYIDLDTFIAQSYLAYDGKDKMSFHVNHECAALFERVLMMTR